MYPAYAAAPAFAAVVVVEPDPAFVSVLEQPPAISSPTSAPVAQTCFMAHILAQWIGWAVTRTGRPEGRPGGNDVDGFDQPL